MSCIPAFSGSTSGSVATILSNWIVQRRKDRLAHKALGGVVTILAYVSGLEGFESESSQALRLRT